MFLKKYEVNYKIPINDNREEEGMIELFVRDEAELKYLVPQKIVEDIGFSNKEEAIDFVKEIMKQEDFIWIKRKPGIFICDVCEKEINHLSMLYKISIFINNEISSQIDICDDCYNKVYEIISNFKYEIIKRSKELKEIS